MTQDKYEVEGDTFLIQDQELDLDLEGSLEFLERETYPTGEVRFETYRKGEQLHGPSYFYDKHGGLLSESWFFEGIAVGKVKRYYPSGALYCIERFVEGAPHLLQEYFYLDGSVKTQVPYVHGQIDGKVVLYWPDGTLKRESTYEKGTCVTDRFYDENGEEMHEAERALS